MNINIRGALFLKADRLNERVDDFAKWFMNLPENRKTISREQFKDFVKSIHVIIDTEMNDKGVERKWKK